MTEEIEFNTNQLNNYAYKAKIVPTQKSLNVELTYAGNDKEEVAKGIVGLWMSICCDLESNGFEVSPIRDPKKQKPVES